MKENKKGTYVILGILLVAVAGLSIAYAALSTTLNVNFGTVTQTAQTWNVKFKEGNVTATVGGTSATGRSCGTATVSTDGLTITVGATQLSKPSDSCVWQLTVQNNGTIDATLSGISATDPTGTGFSCTPTSGATNTLTCGNIIYKLGTNNTCSTLLATGGTLAKKSGSTPGSQTIYLCATYDSSKTSLSNSSAEIVQTGTKFTLTYGQK